MSRKEQRPGTASRVCCPVVPGAAHRPACPGSCPLVGTKCYQGRTGQLAEQRQGREGAAGHTTSCAHNIQVGGSCGVRQKPSGGPKVWTQHPNLVPHRLEGSGWLCQLPTTATSHPMLRKMMW